MNLTDIYIPAVDETYDFMLDENVPVIQIMEDFIPLCICHLAANGI